MHSAIFLINNIHCPSCVSLITEVFSQENRGAGVINVDVSLIKQTVRVSFDENVTDYAAIAAVLAGSAFKIQHVIILDAHGTQIDDHDMTLYSNQEMSGWHRMWHRAKKDHIENCEACQREQARTSNTKVKAKSWATIVRTRKLDAANRGRVSVASTTRTAVDNPVVLNVDGAVPGEHTTTYKTSISIEGMTCGVCVGSITRGVENLPYVLSVNVDLLTNSGTFEIRGRHNVNELIEKIEDLGYDAHLVSLVEISASTQAVNERTIEIKIDGMHCSNCPIRVQEALYELAHASPTPASFKVLSYPSLSDPIVQVAYIPSLEDAWTARRFISTLQAIDPSFDVRIHHPPTLEERSRRLQHLERMSILRRLIFTGIVAIPTLIIGVVYMALVPKQNGTRLWFEEAIWAGDAKRIEWALFIMTTPVMCYGADIFHRRAAREIWQMWRPGSSFPLLKRLYRFGSMNLLISAATTIAYASSLAVLILDATRKSSHHDAMSSTYFDAVTFLTFFILIGRFLEAYSKAKTGDAVTMLGKLRPCDAYLVEQDTHKVPVDQLELGDVVQIPRGHSPPADGVIEQEGVFAFDESSLTGESKPVKKQRGDSVYTGTVNVADPVEIRVNGLGGASVLDQIISVVRSGQSKRAPIERFADVLTGFFVPVITLLAIVTWIVWLSLGVSGALPGAWLEGKQGGWPFWSLEFAIAVFVIACPCGIGLAAPTALFVGGGLAARKGILVQGGGQAFQEASKLNTVIFDKTGTLTAGKMMVTNVEPLSSDITPPNTALTIAKRLEELSSHPIAQAIVSHCSSATAEVILTLSEVQEHPGQGVTAKVELDGVTGRSSYHAAIGNERLFEGLNAHSSLDIEKQVQDSDSSPLLANVFLRQALTRHQTLGHSVAILALRRPNEQKYTPTTLFALSDPLRPEALSVITQLRARGLQVYMCTGDNPTTASAIASQLSIPVSHIRAGVLPAGKADYVRELQHPDPSQPAAAEQPRNIVAFIGDGLNDTPALAAADVSISPSSGSDIAINASSFILLTSSLDSIVTLIDLSKRVFLRVKLNFFWAAVYNCVLIPVAAGVFFPIGMSEEKEGWRLGPVWAAIAMAASSVSVVASSLALRLPELRFGRRRSE